MLMICGESLDFDLITSRLRIKGASSWRSGEMQIPTVEQGATRQFDPRMFLDRWAKGLRGKACQQDLEQQIEVWVSQLYPVRSAFAEFKTLGYWSVLDCVGTAGNFHYGSVQYRLRAELLEKVTRLGIDIDFTVNVGPVE